MRIEKYKLIAKIFFWTFWICATVPFFVQELTNERHNEVLLSLWALGEIIFVGLGIWTLRARVDKMIIAIFLTVSFIDTVLANHLSVMYWINGCRFYIAFLFIIPIFRYFWTDDTRRRYFIRRMDRLIYIYLVIQFPCMVIQFLRYGAFDNVSGSIGQMQSGNTSTIIYLASFYLMLRRWDKNASYFKNLLNNWQLLVLLLPTFKNETKVSFIYILMYFFFLVPMDRRFLKRMVYIIPLMVVVAVGSGILYSKMVEGSKVVSLDDVSAYVVGDDQMLELVEYIFENDVIDVEETDYARGLKFMVLPMLYDRHPKAWFFGFGVSQYKGGLKLDKTDFAKRYFWMMQGCIMQWHAAMVDMGIPGGILYILFWITVFRLWRRHKGERNLQMSWMLGLVTCIVSVYCPFMDILPIYVQYMYFVFVCSRWNELPAYQHIPLLGSKKFAFSLHD